MDVNELKELKKEIMLKYNEDKKTRDNNGQSDLINKRLEYIKKEIDKVDSLINIYNVDDIEYRVMKLERLYMRLMNGMTDKEFSSITREEEFKLFNDLFPEKWSFSFSIDEKLKYLEEAISSNRIINQIISSKFTKYKKNSILNKLKSDSYYEE